MMALSPRLGAVVVAFSVLLVAGYLVFRSGEAPRQGDRPARRVERRQPSPSTAAAVGTEPREKPAPRAPATAAAKARPTQVVRPGKAKRPVASEDPPNPLSAAQTDELARLLLSDKIEDHGPALQKLFNVRVTRRVEIVKSYLQRHQGLDVDVELAKTLGALLSGHEALEVNRDIVRGRLYLGANNGMLVYLASSGLVIDSDDHEADYELLRSLLSTSDRLARLGALQAVAVLQVPAVDRLYSELLAEAVDVRSGQERFTPQNVIGAIARRGSEEGRRALLDALPRTGPADMSYILQGLAGWKRPEDVELIASYMGHANPRVRGIAQATLLSIRIPAAADAQFRLATHPGSKPGVRLMAAQALVELKDRRAIPILLELLAGSDHENAAHGSLEDFSGITGFRRLPREQAIQAWRAWYEREVRK